ncbi:MAG: sigma-70 family RNA polymerase sigma factor [Pseudomonadota bacterium]
MRAETDCQNSAQEPSLQQSQKEKLLNELYRNHANTLLGYLKKAFGAGPPEPEDVVQNAFEKLADRVDLFEITNPQAYLWRIARNLFLTQRRNQDTRSKFDFEVEHLFFAMKGDEFAPERVLEVKEQLNLISEALSLMPERRRNAFMWHRIEGLNVAAVARRLNVTRAAAVKQIARATLDIDRALQANDPKDPVQ